jgi:O-antigen/teichoic acid export membrane protein
MTGNQQHVPLTRFFSSLIPFAKRNSYAARVIELILNDPLYKGVLVLGSGTAVAQLIGIVAMPIITRLYTPSDMGVLAVYSSILGIVGIGATLKYEFAYSLPQKDEDAANLFGLCLILLFITTAGFAIILFFGGGLLIDTFNMDIIEQYLWFLLAGFFGMGLYTILNYWAIRQRDYNRITYTKITQGAGGVVCKILLGFLSFGPMGLIIAYIVSQIAGIGTLANAMWSGERENLKAISLSGMMSAAKTYKSFPVFNFPASILNTISLQLPPLMLLSLYDSQIVGFYAFAQMFIVLPGSVISGSMGQAYLGEASKMVREESRELRSLYLRTLKHLSIIALPLIGIPALCAPFVVPIIFGKAWAEAGWYCWPLAFEVIVAFVVSSTSWLEIYSCNQWVLIWDVTRVVGVLFGFYICLLFDLSPVVAISIYAAIMSFMHLIYILMNLKAITCLNKIWS